MALPGYTRIPGTARHYREVASGRELTYDQYLAASRDGMNSHQYQTFRKEPRNLALMNAYKEQSGGKMAGLRLAIDNLKASERKSRRDKRMALSIFYPEALNAPDERYPVRGAA